MSKALRKSIYNTYVICCLSMVKKISSVNSETVNTVDLPDLNPFWCGVRILLPLR